MNEAKQATPHSVLIEQLMDSRIPKTEREHAARREIEMLREALRLPAQKAEKQEPVAWYDSESGITDFHSFKPVRKPSSPTAEWLPLYTAPHQWVGLTDEEIVEIANAPPVEDARPVHSFARAIEAKLKEKNHA